MMMMTGGIRDFGRHLGIVLGVRVKLGVRLVKPIVLWWKRWLDGGGGGRSGTRGGKDHLLSGVTGLVRGEGGNVEVVWRWVRDSVATTRKIGDVVVE